MSAELTDYGFKFGAAEVIRYGEIDGTVLFGVEVNGKRTLEISVSPTGRSVRVFKGQKELK